MSQDKAPKKDAGGQAPKNDKPKEESKKGSVLYGDQKRSLSKEVFFGVLIAISLAIIIFMRVLEAWSAAKVGDTSGSAVGLETEAEAEAMAEDVMGEPTGDEL